MTIAIIGGSGFSDIAGISFVDAHSISTPFGEISAPVLQANHNGVELMFMARHGSPHNIPPHKINYRANIWALKQLGVEKIIAINAVGGITSAMGPGVIALPSQIVDYTYGRDHTFSDSADTQLHHVDFTYPYDEALRQQLMTGFDRAGLTIEHAGVYGATQGPRLETIAEINRMERDTCDLVGMTGMPEAGLARELDMAYASVCLVVNWAAGRSKDLIIMDDIEAVMSTGMDDVKKGLLAFLGIY